MVSEELVKFELNYTGNWLVYATGDHGGVKSWRMSGYLTGRRGSKHYACKTDCESLTADQLRSIADKLDELNALPEPPQEQSK